MSPYPSSGLRFHSLQATSHALQPMQIDVSVKKPTRSASGSFGAPPVRSVAARVPHAASLAGSPAPPNWRAT